MKNKVEKLKVEFRDHVEKLYAQYSKAKNDDDYRIWAAELKTLIEDTEYWARTKNEPVRLPPISNFSRGGIIYRDTLYKIEGQFTEEQRSLLVMEDADKERQHFEKLKTKFTSPEAVQASKQRERIPEAVRVAVWRRDQGKCAHCSSRKNLEYDHIIPVVKGGSNTVRNIELLCEECHGPKGNRIDEVPKPFFLEG